MSDPKAQQEPSIEEILSSIRQIINEDTDEPTQVAEVVPDADVDVLDLADLAPSKPEPAPAPAPEPEKPMAVDDIDAMFDTPAPAPTPAPEPAPAPAAPQPVAAREVEDSLLSESALSAATASLTKLAQAEVMIDHKHAAGIGSVTLEDVVKEMLRPMMKSWLDENLPPLVERLVQKEIQKLSSRL